MYIYIDWTKRIVFENRIQHVPNKLVYSVQYEKKSNCTTLYVVIHPFPWAPTGTNCFFFHLEPPKDSIITRHKQKKNWIWNEGWMNEQTEHHVQELPCDSIWRWVNIFCYTFFSALLSKWKVKLNKQWR